VHYDIELNSAAHYPVRDIVDLSPLIEQAGFGAFWKGESNSTDPFVLISAIAARTKKLKLGTAIYHIYGRSAVTLGIQSATLQDLSDGRLLLGLGVANKTIAGWHGGVFDRPLRRAREYIEIVRKVAAGERLNVEGKFYRSKNFRLTAPPPTTPVRVYLAALGPEMLELAGEIADGVLLNWIPPEAVPASLARIQVGARRVGRTLDNFEIASFIRTCVTDDAAAARETLARDITGYATVDVYASFFRTAGYADEVSAVGAAWGAGDRAGAVKRVSPRMLDGLGVVGNEAFCRARVAEFAGTGLTQPVIVPFAPAGADRASLLRTLRAFP
jgi:probable F420-dependent oxidoreductase